MPKIKSPAIKPLPSTPTQASFVSRGNATSALLPTASPLSKLAKAKTSKPSLVGGVV